MKAPLIQSIWSSGTMLIHFSPMVQRMNSRDTNASPKRAGKERKAVKRIILRNTCCSRLCSSRTLTKTGCATCPTIPPTV